MSLEVIPIVFPDLAALFDLEAFLGLQFFCKLQRNLHPGLARV
jgi:hypothetical protein